MPTTRRALAWAHGCLSVQSLGAMLGPVLFILPDGRQISPFHIAPWGNDPDRHILPPILRELRGEWPCVPFGSDGPRALPSGWNASGETFNGADVPHGYSSNAHWDWGDCDDSRITLQCEYPAEHPVSSVRRCITPDPAAAAIDITLEVRVRRTCNLPIGLHPTFRLSPRTGSVEIEPGIHGAVRSFPGDVEPGATLFAKDASWPALQGVTTREGKPVDAARVPFACQAEDLLQLTDIGGSLTLHYRDEGFRVQLHWQKEHFPSVLLWYSNWGRRAYPWNGNHLALGVEPICAAFDLGPGISAASNPISRAGTATSIMFHPDIAFVTRYRISVEPDLLHRCR